MQDHRMALKRADWTDRIRIARSRARRAQFPASVPGAVQILLGANQHARALTRVRAQMSVSRGTA